MLYISSITNFSVEPRPVKRCIAIVLLLTTAALSPATATEPGEDIEEPMFRPCIDSRSIRSTDVLNDNTIVFRTIGGKFYLNQLPQTCRGLSRDRRFTYQLYERRLCENDRIRVLLSAGTNMVEGRSCKLGEFRKLSADEVESIYTPGPSVPEPAPVESAEVEELEPESGEKEN